MLKKNIHLNREKEGEFIHNLQECEQGMHSILILSNNFQHYLDFIHEA